MPGARVARTAFAVVAAYAANGLLVFVTEQWLAGAARGGSYYFADLTSQALIGLIAGFLCCVLSAPESRRTAMASLIGMGLVVGSVSLVVSWGEEPHWYGAGLLTVFGPGVWTGYRIALKVRP